MNTKYSSKVKKIIFCAARIDQMYKKIGHFVVGGGFVSFVSTSEDEISTILKNLNKSMTTIEDDAYIEYLNKFGCVWNNGIELTRPLSTKEKIKWFEMKQKRFESYCREKKMTKKHVKHLWLIAEVGNDCGGEKYYMDTSEIGKNHIYCVSRKGKFKLFAENFVDFLNKSYKIYFKNEDEDYEKQVTTRKQVKTRN